jgi:hypothetical protein
MTELYLHSHIRFHGVVLNYLNTGTIWHLPYYFVLLLLFYFSLIFFCVSFSFPSPFTLVILWLSFCILASLHSYSRFYFRFFFFPVSYILFSLSLFLCSFYFASLFSDFIFLPICIFVFSLFSLLPLSFIVVFPFFLPFLFFKISVSKNNVSLKKEIYNEVIDPTTLNPKARWLLYALMWTAVLGGHALIRIDILSRDVS